MGRGAGALPLLLLLPSLLSAQLSTVSELEETSSLEITPTPYLTDPNTTDEKGLSPGTLPTSLAPATLSSEEDRSAAENYLYTGDSSSLVASSCTRAFQLPARRGPPPRDLLPLLHQAISSLTNAANFLNLIFQASELRETSVQEDIEWYHALVRAMLEGDRPGLVRRAFLTFDADPTIQQPQLVLRASKGTTQDILLQDLTSAWPSFRPPAPDQSWFDMFKSSSPPLHALSKRVLLNDLSTLDTPKWARGDSYVINSSGVQWGESPFLECVDGRYLPGWLLSLSLPFYGLKPDLSPEFRGVIRVDVNIQGFSVDQCASGDFWFANTHQCNRTSMECEPIPQQGFRMNQYCCRCKRGYYSPIPDIGNRRDSQQNNTRGCYPEVPVCLPCWPGCDECQDGSPCWVQEDWLLRTAVLTVQGLFMILVLVSMLVAYQCRRTKRIRSSGLLLLEMILCGSLLLYFPVFILYFKPSTFRCILLRWVRLLGFAVVYGTVTLKMYRVLKVFLSRTAQRVPYITTTGVLRMLGVIVLTVSWFLCAWTVGVLQNRDRNVPLLIISTTSEGQGFNVCDLDRWDYMMAVAELLFLCWGSFLCSAVKTVPSAFHEPRYMSIAIHNELLLSSMFHLLRFARPSIHPDWMLLLFFTHTHVTITVTLGLLFVPKFLHMSRTGREEIAAEVYEDEVDLRRSCSYLNSSFTSNCYSDHSLDPDDIRDELKKLYSQLEVHKTKRMANSNPHLPKKRSSRLSIGRSLIKRITEIPESLSRQCSREDKDVSAAIGSITRSGSYYKGHQTPSINTMTETLMQPSPKLRKSHSAYDCSPERESSLLNSSFRSKTDKRASQHSDAGSINTTLLVCKSASAHNLSVDTNLLLPEPSRFQKSLSVIERNDHRSLAPCRSIENVSLPSKAEKPQLTVDVDIKRQTSSALLNESFDKAEVCPWEVPEELPANKNQKHVTYSLSNQEEPKSPGAPSSPTLLFVCPWEFLPPPSPPATETGNGIQTDVESAKTKLPISCSAPGSPHTIAGKPKDFRVFSFRSTTQSLLVAKGIGESGRSMSREKSFQESNVKEGTLQKSLSTSMRLSPGSATSEKRTPLSHRRAMTTIGTKPCLVKQTAIRLPSTDSPEKSPKHTAPVHICPWESEEVILEVKKQIANDNVLQRQYSDKQVLSVTVSNDGSRPPEFQPKSLLSVPNTEVCPWDVPKPFHQTSISDVCPWEVVEVEQLQTKGTRTDVCPWETDCDSSRVTDDNTCSVEVPVYGNTQKQVNVKLETRPSSVLETNISQVRQGSIKSCSDTIKPGERVIYVNVSQSSLDQELAQKEACSMKTDQTQKKEESDFPDPPPPVIDICPCESEPNTKPPLKETMTKKATVCPWEVEDSEKPEDREDAKNKGLTKVDQESVYANVCPWETSETVKTTPNESVSGDVCPWEKGEPVKTLQKQESVHEIVCPWETAEKTKTLQKQESVHTGVCQVDTGQAAKTSQKQDGVRVNVCPWETGEPVSTLQKQESVSADVCPWEKEDSTKISQRQDCDSAIVCPWETGEPTKTLQKQESVHEDVCPWEAGEPVKTLRKQESVHADVCPWETGEPTRTLQKQESVHAHVCPWETEEPTRTLQKQQSVHAEVCPWETGEPTRTLQKQESVHADVCPWETGEPTRVLQKQESIRADICPWETGQPVKTLQKQESVYSDVCPWEEKPSPQQSLPQDSTRSDSLKRQESGQASVCPWENNTATTESSTSQTIPDIDRTNPSDTQTTEEVRVNTPLARRDALCPWEMEGGRQESITVHDNVDVFTWEETIPEEDDGDAETAAEAFIFPPDL